MAAASRPPAGTLELTTRAVIIGLVLSVVMGAANVYLGLKVGMTVSASIPAAVIGLLVLRTFFKSNSILEANQVQTAASAGESLAAGIIFTMPALVILGVWADFDMLLTTLIAFSGGLLGILFMIPMRRVFVVGDNDELKYPEGVACAAVLEGGQADHASAMSIVRGVLWGAGLKALISFVGVIQGAFHVAGVAAGRAWYAGTEVSFALVAVGYIVKLNVAVLIFVGGAIAWLIMLPIATGAEGMLDASLIEAFWAGKIRYAGVGAMVVGGLGAIWSVRSAMASAVREIRKKRDPSEVVADTERDLSTRVILFFSAVAVVIIAIVYSILTKDIGIALVTTLIMVVMSFFFTGVASYIVGLVGNTNSPVSGMTITAVLVTGGLLLVFGFSGAEGIVATLGVAAIVCCAACTSGDVCNDLKTGALVGASPYRQQMMQIAGIAVAALVMAPVMQLLHDNVPGGIGGKNLSAPQASLFASLAEMFFGKYDPVTGGVIETKQNLPWVYAGIGVAIGFVLLIADSVLKAKKAKMRLYVMPVAVGMYLPFDLAPPILLGGVIAWAVARGAKSPKAQDKRLHRGIMFCSGLIAGEALMGVVLAILASVGLKQLDLGLPGGVLTALSVGAFFVVLAVVGFESRPKPGAGQ